MMDNEEVGSRVISVCSAARAEVSGSHRGQRLQIGIKTQSRLYVPIFNLNFKGVLLSGILFAKS